MLGERLGLEAGVADSQISIMMIGAVVVFSSRIFTNLAVLRRLLIDRLRVRRATRSVEVSTVESSDAAPALPSSRQPGNAV